jgi:phenylacetate-CoA ligase
VLPEGEAGELVLTNLTKVGLPAIRYRTGDITSLTREPCDCGRTHARMDNVTGRTDDQLNVPGVNLYASGIEAAMVDLEPVAPHYRIDLDREDALDRMRITVEHHADYDGDPADLEDRVEKRLTEVLEVQPDGVEVVGPGGVERQETGKVRRVFDHRET